MGWQRFNRTSKVFEVSDDNGSTWQVLKIANAGLDTPATVPPNIAYTNASNIFTQHQIISLGQPRLEMIDLASPVDARRFDILLTGQAFYIQTLNDAGGFQQNVLSVDRAGSLTISGSIGCANNTWRSNLHTSGGYLYPARIDSGPGTLQTSWYLASHGSYGLYSNTGIYVEGSIFSNSWIYDNTSKAAGVPICYPIYPDINSYVSTPYLPKAGQMSCAIVGKMVWISLYFAGTVNGGAPDVASYSCTIPFGKVAAKTGGTTSMVYDGMGWGTGLLNWAEGGNVINLYGSNLRPYQQNQIQYHYSSFWIPIQ